MILTEATAALKGCPEVTQQQDGEDVAQRHIYEYAYGESQERLQTCPGQFPEPGS